MKQLDDQADQNLTQEHQRFRPSEAQRYGGAEPHMCRWMMTCIGVSVVMLYMLVAPALAWQPDALPLGTQCFADLRYAGGAWRAMPLAVFGVMLVPLVMAYRPGDEREYVFHKGLEETAGEFFSGLTSEDAKDFVAIMGAGPAGLRTAELIMALNRQVPENERKKILLFDRNPVPTGLGAYGIPPVKKQGVLKDGVVQQAQGIMHGMVGKKEWHIFPQDRFLQVVDSEYIRFFPRTNVGTDVTLEQLEQLGIPLIIATGAQHPRVPTDAQGEPVPGRHLAGVVSATSEFFRKIGTEWLIEKKGVQGLRYEGKEHDLRGKKVIMIYGGGNVASDAFMWVFRNTPPETDVLLVYRGELHGMTNMSRPYYKPIDAALQEQRAASPVFTSADVLDVTALQTRIKQPQRVVDALMLDILQVAPEALDTMTADQMVEALNTVLHMPDLVQRLPHTERGSFRLDLHPIFAAAQEHEADAPRANSRDMLTLARTLLEMEYPNEIRRLHRANMFGLLTVEAYLDKAGHGQVTHVLLRKHRRGDVVLDRKTGAPVLLRSNVIERENIMRHRVTKEKLFKWNTVPSEECIELAVDSVIEAIGDVVQPLGDLEVTPWQTFKAHPTTGRVDGREIWVTGQALTQKGKVRDSYVSAHNTMIDIGPVLYPHSWERHQLLRVLISDLEGTKDR